MDKNKTVTKDWGLVSFFTFISRIIGYIRDLVIAYFFGAGILTDAFYVAFRIPNLLRRLFAEGSLTIAFVPIFTDYLESRSEADAKQALKSVFTVVLSVLIVVSVAGVVFSPYLIRIFANGFDPETYKISVSLNRLMFPYILFISLSALAMAVLNSLKHFFAPSFSPVIFNLSIIASILLFNTKFDYPIYSAAIGVILGGILQLLLNIFFLKAKDYNFGLSSNVVHPAVKKLGILIAPQVFGVGVYNLNILINTQYASYMPSGTVSYLYFAERLIEFPLGIVAVSIATVLLPTLSSNVSSNNLEDFKKNYLHSLNSMLFIIMPAAVGLMVLSLPICSVLFQRGQFDYNSAVFTSQALLGYSIGIWAVGGIRITVPAFYALKDTRTPVYIAFIALLANAGLGYVLGFKYGLNHLGLALSSSISSFLNFSLLFYLLNKRVMNLMIRENMFFFFKIIIASMLMGIFAYLLSGILNLDSSVNTVYKMINLAVTLILSACIYLLLSKFFKISELNQFLDLIRPKR